MLLPTSKPVVSGLAAVRPHRALHTHCPSQHEVDLKHSQISFYKLRPDLLVYTSLLLSREEAKHDGESPATLVTNACSAVNMPFLALIVRLPGRGRPTQGSSLRFLKDDLLVQGLAAQDSAVLSLPF